MIKELLEKYNITFEPLITYIETLDKEKINIVDDDNDSLCRQITLIKEDGTKVIIYCLTDKDKTWISFYDIDTKERKVGQINFISYKQKEEGGLPLENNNFITYHKIDIKEPLVYVLNSGYSYQNNTLKEGWRKKKEVLFKDIEKVSQTDNLANLSLHIENSNINVISEEEEKIGFKGKLKLYY